MPGRRSPTRCGMGIQGTSEETVIQPRTEDATPSTTAPTGTLKLTPRLTEAIIGVAAAIYAAIAVAKFSGVISMSGGELAIIAIRMTLPLLILRYWLVGAVIAMLIDMLDVVIIELIGLGGFRGHYAQTDKLLDSYYYVLELIIAFGWANPWARIPAVLLFVYRLIGAVIFEFTGAHIWLFIFPNLFENWWLYVVVVLKWFPSLVPSGWKNTLVALAILLVPKMGQEYLLHFAEAHPWDWTKSHVLEPMGIEL